MEGGIGIILLVVILLVGGGIGIALYLTGGALWLGKTSPKGDRIEGSAGGGEERSRFKHVDMPPEEHVTLAGTEAGEREHRERSRDD